MKGRKGFTLIEIIIAVTLFSFVIIGFMQGLNASILGSHRARMNNAAMDVARSQMEYVHQQGYIVHDYNGIPIEWNETQEQYVHLDPYTDSYNKVTDMPDGFSTEGIDINVSLVPAPGMGYDTDPFGNESVNRSAMQKITVDVSYENGNRHISMTGYKAPRLARVVRGAGRYPVSKELTGIPGLWGISDGGAQGIPADMIDCCGSEGCHPESECTGWGAYGNIRGGEGYYYVFRTGTTGPICCSWIYRNHPYSCFEHIDSVGGKNYANIYLYSGIPAEFNDEGQGQGLVEVIGGEYYPKDICNSDPGCTFEATVGTHDSADGERYLASIGNSSDNRPPGVYTVLYHNWGYYDIGIDTTSASVAYYW